MTLHPAEREAAFMQNLWLTVERQQRALEELGDLTRRCIALLETMRAEQNDLGRRIAALEMGDADADPGRADDVDAL